MTGAGDPSAAEEVRLVAPWRSFQLGGVATKRMPDDVVADLVLSWECDCMSCARWAVRTLNRWEEPAAAALFRPRFTLARWFTQPLELALVAGCCAKGVCAAAAFPHWSAYVFVVIVAADAWFMLREWWRMRFGR